MKKENDIFNTLKKQSLTESERELLLSKLNEYRAHKPMRGDISAARPTPSPFLFGLRPMPVIASFLIFAFVGTGTAAAAEGALPGDILYPVKTGVTENVRAAFAVDAEARADFEAWRAERRLDETTQLVVRARLTQERKEKLEERFSKHAQNVEVRIAHIAETDTALAAELSVEFEAALLAHETILADIDATTTASTRTLVQTNIDRLSRLRAQTVGGVAVKNRAAGSAETQAVMMENVSADEALLPPDAAVDDSAIRPFEPLQFETVAKRLYGASEAALEKTTRLYKEVHDSLTDTQRARVEAQLKKATAVFEAGQKAYAAGEYELAYQNFQSVLRAMNTLAIFLKNSGRIDIEFREIDPELPLPKPLPLPAEILLPADSEQIDPPSLELETGPEDTDIDEKEVDTDNAGRVKGEFFKRR